MKKFFLFFFLMIAFAFTVMSQESDLSRPESTYYISKGDQLINVSVGLLNQTDFAFSLFGADGSGEPSPSFNASYEYGLSSMVSIAGFASYYRVDAQSAISLNTIADQVESLDLSDLGSIFSSIECILNPSACANESTLVEERISVYTIGGKLRIHRAFIPGLDTYASTYLGYSFNRRKTITEQALDVALDELDLNTEIPTVVYYGSLGARYFLTNKLGLFGEYGLGNVHLLKLGATYRLN